MEKYFIVIKHSQSVYSDYFGIFDSRDTAWAWINATDPYRQGQWSVRSIDKVN